MLRFHISTKRLCQRLRNAIVPLIPQTAPTIPIYSMNLPCLQASTYEDANTTSVTRDLFRTLSGEVRLALGTAQLNSLGQHMSTAFLCWVLSGLGSWPCIPSAKGIILFRHVPEASLLLGLFPPEWGDTQAHNPYMPTSISSMACWSRQNLSMNKPAELSVVLLTSLPHLCVYCSM